MGKKTKARSSSDERTQWQTRIQGLLNEAAQWAKEKRWPLSITEKMIEEQAIGSYPAKVLHVKTPSGILIIEPVAYSVVGAGGRVDMYAFPSLHRVRLLLDGRKWVVRTDSGVDFPGEWNRTTFLTLAQDLTTAP